MYAASCCCRYSPHSTGFDRLGANEASSYSQNLRYQRPLNMLLDTQKARSRFTRRPKTRSRLYWRVIMPIGILLACFGTAFGADKVLRAGAYAININPVKLPTHVMGLLGDRTGSAILDDLHARCVVLDDGNERVAIVI